MNTKIVSVSSENVDMKAIEEAGQIIKNGGLVAFPTETVYGLGGDGLNPESSNKIYAAKGRPSDNPLIIHICRIEDLEKIVKCVPEKAKKVIDAFWPGPLTMIFEKRDCVPRETTGGLDTVAVRFPIHETALKFIEAAGGFVAAPSANLSGRPSPTLAKYVCEDLNGRVDMIIDGGNIPIGVESTIVDMTSEIPMILRPGYVTKEMLEEVVGEVKVDPTILDINCKERPKAPGMRYRHYAPKADMTVVRGEDESVIAKILEMGQNIEGCVVLSVSEHIDKYKGMTVKDVGSKEDSLQIASNLYKVLRECDDEGVKIILSESFSNQGIGAAVMNRLIKAAGHQILDV
ncbi:MAG: threonylcarbamoyl-AMP synthase [Lachnospiraceae bacterium]|nr:threonylcarbamoyl-AMP synthase [Lachnospiraceae bacterium]